MLIVMALSTAVLMYCVVDMVLSTVLAQRLKIEERLFEVKRAMSMDEFEEIDNTGLTKKLLMPIYNRFLDFFSIFVTKDVEQLKKTEALLYSAGLRMNPRDYKASVILTMFVCGVLGFGGGYAYFKDIPKALLGGAFGLYIGITITRFSIGGKATKRKAAIYHEMPEMMDLLNVSVSAGLGFDQAMGYIVKKNKGPLYDEINITQREILLGTPRREALQAFAKRCNNMEIQTFVTAIIQADEMGSPLANVLQIQATTIREAHKMAIEEQAQKLSVKILIPMVVFIFPVLFIVLLGPAVMQVVESGAV